MSAQHAGHCSKGWPEGKGVPQNGQVPRPLTLCPLTSGTATFGVAGVLVIPILFATAYAMPTPASPLMAPEGLEPAALTASVNPKATNALRASGLLA